MIRLEQENIIDLSIFLNLEELTLNLSNLSQLYLIYFQDCKRLKRLKILIKNISTIENFEELNSKIQNLVDLKYFELICYSPNSIIFEIENVFFINLSKNYYDVIISLIQNICIFTLNNNDNIRINIKSTYSLFKYFYSISSSYNRDIINKNTHSLCILSNNEGSILEQYNFYNLYSLNIQFIKGSHNDISEIFLSTLSNITTLTITFTSIDDSITSLLYLSSFKKLRCLILNFKFYDINYITKVILSLTENSLLVLRKLHLFTINIHLTYSFNKDLFDKKLILFLRDNLINCYKTNINQIFDI